MELIVIAVLAGIAVLVLWPVARATWKRRSPHDQDAATDATTDTTPPPVPDRPVPGSRQDRARHGKP